MRFFWHTPRRFDHTYKKRTGDKGRGIMEQRLAVQKPCLPARRENGGGIARFLLSTAAVFLLIYAGQFLSAKILAKVFLYRVRDRQFRSWDEMLAAFQRFVESDLCLLGSLFLTAVTIALCLLYCRVIEKKTPAGIGLSLHGMPAETAKGFLAGFGMLSAAVLLAFLSGSLVFGGFCSPSPAALLLFLAAFLVQGTSEEVLLRGFYLQTSIGRVPPAAAVIANAAVFAALHLRNPGIGPLAFFNLMLVGVFFSLLTLGSGSLWGAAAAHGMWNFAQGNFYGILVSGLSVRTTALSFQPQGGMDLISGGAFGLEGGAAASAVLLAAIALAWRRYQKRGWAVALFRGQKRKNR